MSDGKTGRPGTAYAVLVVAVVLQIGLALGMFEPGYGPLSNAFPLHGDYPGVAFWVASAQSAWEQFGRLWGYSPHFMAGAPVLNLWNNALPIQSMAIIPGLGAAQAVYVFLLLSMAAAPLFFYGAARNFRATPLRAAWFAMGAACGATVSSGALMLYFGTVSAFALSVFAPYAVSAICRVLDRFDRSSLIQAFIALPVALWLHKTSAILVAAPVLIITLLSVRKHNLLRVALVFAAGLWTLAANWWWLSINLDYRWLLEGLSGRLYWGDNTTVDSSGAFVGGLWAPKFLTWAGYAALVWLAVKYARARKREAAPLIVAVLSLFLLTVFGARMGALGMFDPYRYTVVLEALACGALMVGAYDLARLVTDKRLEPGLRPPARFAMTVVVAVLIWLLPGTSGPRTLMRSFLPGGDRAAYEAVFDWLVARTDDGSRVLAEQSTKDPEGPAALPPWGGIYAIAGLALDSGRTFVGGMHPEPYLQTGNVNFPAGRLMGADMSSLGADELRAFFELYNIGTVLCFSDVCRAVLTGMPEVATPMLAPPGFAAWRVDGGGWVLDATVDRVTQEFNRVEIAGVYSPAGGPPVLKMHYFGEMVSEPAGIGPAEVEGSRLPFIALPAGVSDVVITLR